MSKKEKETGSGQDNMSIWNRVAESDPDMIEKVSFGQFKFSTIDAQSQLQKATEVFGPCGLGWGIRNQKFEMLTVDPTDAHFNLLGYTAELWYIHNNKESVFEIASDIELFENTKNGWKRVSDPYKKVRTDGVTKGLSWLGFNADVFLGKFDNQKYVESLHHKKDVKEKTEAKLKAEGKELPQEAQLDEIQALALEVGLSGQLFADYLKNEFDTSWSRIDRALAQTIILDLKNRQQSVKPAATTVTEAISQEPDAEHLPDAEPQAEAPKTEPSNIVQMPKAKAKLPPKTVDEYFEGLSEEDVAKANSDKDIEKKLVLNQTARKQMNELYAAAPNKDHIMQAISKACKDITGFATLMNDALSLTKISVRKLETLIKTLKTLGA